MTVTRDEMLPQARAVCPEWECREDKDLLYMALRDFGWHVWKLLLLNDAEALRPVFALFERWLIEGDREVRLACSVGVFEALKHAEQGKDAAYHEAERIFMDMLGPVSRKEWDAA